MFFKILFSATILAGIFLGVSLGYIIFKSRINLVELSLRNLEITVSGEVEKIQEHVSEVTSILSFLSVTPPVQGLIRALENNGFDPIGNSTTAEWKNRLEDIISSEMLVYEFFDQLRYINEDGYEMVRVDFINGEASVISNDKLQYKGDRYYFTDAMMSQRGEIYVSVTDLNREGNPPRLSIPYRPMIRVAVPIFEEETQERRGIFIANILADELVSEIGIEGLKFTDLFIVNADGFFILHPNEEREWGSSVDLDTGYSLNTEFPDLGQEAFSGLGGSFVTDKDVYAFGKVRLSESNSALVWTVIVRATLGEIFGSINSAVKVSVIIGLSTFIVLFFGFLFLIRTLLRPLKELSDGAKRIGQGDFDATVVVHSDDEIGRVGIAFNTMTKRLKTMYSSLEEQVAEKTKDLKVEVGELEKVRSAMANVLEDVESERNKAENLVLDLQKFKLAVDNASDHIVITDPEGVVLYGNKMVEKITGYTLAEALGKKAGTLWSVPMPKEYYVKFWDTIKNKKQAFVGEIQNRRKNGDLYTAAISVSAVLDGQGKILFFVGIERDITNEKRLDKAKSDFISFASHQLRTPLTGIRWVIDGLLNNEKLTKKGREYISDIDKSATKLTKLVDTLLDLSRIKEGNLSVTPESFDFVSFFKDYLEECDPMIDKKKLKLAIIKSPVALPVLTDKSAVRNIVQSIVSNAMEYTPEGGNISISITRGSSTFTFSVKDNGIGIPKEAHSIIFEQFARAKNAELVKVDGTGLGMYIAKQAVTLLRGKIWFESEEGKGTTFFVELPTKSKPVQGTKHLV